MLNNKNSISITELLGKKAYWESWSERFLSCGKHKGNKKLLVSSGSPSGLDKISTQDEYENARISKKLNQTLGDGQTIKKGDVQILPHEEPASPGATTSHEFLVATFDQATNKNDNID